MAYNIGQTAVQVAADTDNSVKVTNTSASTTVYYKATSDVSTSDTALAGGSSVTLNATAFFIAASPNNVPVEVFPQTRGNLPSYGAPHGFHNWQPSVATSGTDTAFASGTLFVSSIFIPTRKTITGVGFLVGSVGGTDKVVVQLNDANGQLLANSTLASSGTTAGTAANTQEIAFTSPFTARGAGLYYIGVSANGATAKLRTVPAFCNAGLWAGSVSQTAATPASIVQPITFTADKAPIAYVY